MRITNTGKEGNSQSSHTRARLGCDEGGAYRIELATHVGRQHALPLIIVGKQGSPASAPPRGRPASLLARPCAFRKAR
jgi:hypothetical protein